ncbi:MAG: 4Fe-4S binding protein [Alphaproteobacteria bacterium]|nr:4Fe-4S binding protein [Alphaproteobacteria bacterium]
MRKAGEERHMQPFARAFAGLLAALFLVLLLHQARAASEMNQPPDAETIQAFAAAALNVAEGGVRLEPADGMGQRIVSNGELVGYLGSTWDIAKTAGYSARPIDILVVVDLQAVIRGTLLAQQQEPVLTLGITPEQIKAFTDGFAGYDLKAVIQPGEKATGVPDAIAGATISSGVIRSGVIRTARSLAAHHGLLSSDAARQLDMRPGAPQGWKALVASGAVGELRVLAGDADKAIGVTGTAAPDSPFIDLYAAVIDPPEIATSLLGEGAYSELAGAMQPGDHGLFIGGNGLYSFKGTSWRKSGTFERIEIAQGSRTIPLTREQHRVVPSLMAEGAPELREMAVFILPAASGFDPAADFRLSLIASRENSAGELQSGQFTLTYRLPERYLQPVATPAPPPAEMPLWEQNWRGRILAIGIVVAMLLALYVILIFQNQIAARPPLYRAVRITYLLTTTIVLGAFLGAQLSVVHVLTFTQAIRSQFNWETFLLDPVIFVIWGWVAVALLFWGRVYCGWLCPFGALQELLNKLAQRLGVRQFAVPFMLHERLWPIKYIIFLGLFAISLASMTAAFKAAEVEPFKTAISFHFVRAWPFALYALGLLVAGLFIERFYCRYLCPLGAALAIPARLRMFEWLKRRPQCGRECRICSTKCPVQAIHPEGHINPNECVYCLNCQTLYHNEHICPPLKARAARRGTFAPTEKAST